jgi:putative membrane protein
MTRIASTLSAAVLLLACAKGGTSPSPEAPAPAYEPVASEQVAPVDPGLAPAVASPSPEAIVPSSPGVPDPATAPVAQSPGDVPPAAKIQGLTDAQIVTVTETVNKGEIEQATLAKSKSKNPEVKSFASHMITEHTKASQQGKQLAKAEKLVPEDSATAQDVSAKGESTLATLKAADKTTFDRQYIDAQVEQHQTVLQLIDDQLLPSASDAELKAQLEKTRGMVQAHLEAAKALQDKLPKEGTTASLN